MTYDKTVEDFLKMDEKYAEKERQKSNKKTVKKKANMQMVFLKKK
jgi:hypothetical protein